jgi:hypothetical protein
MRTCVVEIATSRVVNVIERGLQIATANAVEDSAPPSGYAWVDHPVAGIGWSLVNGTLVDQAVRPPAPTKDELAAAASDSLDRLQFDVMFTAENNMREVRSWINVLRPGTFTAARRRRSRRLSIATLSSLAGRFSIRDQPHRLLDPLQPAGLRRRDRLRPPSAARRRGRGQDRARDGQGDGSLMGNSGAFTISAELDTPTSVFQKFCKWLLNKLDPAHTARARTAEGKP